MLVRYAVCRNHEPHLVLFTSTSLDEVALAIVAQPGHSDGLEVYANDGSFNRPLTAAELASLSLAREEASSQ